jgi:hypothetical protein
MIQSRPPSYSTSRSSRRIRPTWRHALLRACLMFVALAAPTGHAQNESLQAFEVELIVFRVTNPSATTEDWALEAQRAQANLPAVRDGEETAPAAASAMPVSGLESSVEILSANRLRMNNIAAALQRNPNYQPIAHVGWSQPGFALDNPRPIAIESLLPPGGDLTGAVTLMRGRYVHLGLNLSLRSAADGQTYVLREQRRMQKSGERHYLDHPHFGVIALVTPK